MSAGPQADTIAILIELHRGLPRQGPGDAVFTRAILADLPPLPPAPRIADLGCGSGAGALALAAFYQAEVTAVDAAAEFIAELREHARLAGLDHLVAGVCADMAALAWAAGSLDLLWSEGAAYTLGFEEALTRWRPLMAPGGLAVVSELSWFGEERPGPARDFWSAAYPGMAGEAENRLRGERAGFETLFTRRLPSDAWWKNYYGPLRGRLRDLEITPRNRAVVQECEEEMALFERFGDFYGYTFYVLRAAGKQARRKP